MDEPTPRVSRLALAAAFAATIAVGAGGFLAGRATTPRPIPARAIPDPSPTATGAIITGVLGRVDLIALAAQAADAAASGRPPYSDNRAADGRRFEIRLPFGCASQAGPTSPSAMTAQYDEAAETLRLSVAPQVWQVAEWWPGVAQDAVHGVEGFWIERPWSSSEDCPPSTDTGAQTASGEGEDRRAYPQTLAIAQIHGSAGSRRGRRDGQPYRAVVRIAPDQVNLERGFRLLISGRLAPGPGGDLVSCISSSVVGAPPVCMISAAMDEIAIENPATGETLARWTIAVGDGRSDVANSGSASDRE